MSAPKYYVRSGGCEQVQVVDCECIKNGTHSVTLTTIAGLGKTGLKQPYTEKWIVVTVMYVQLYHLPTCGGI